MLENEDFGDTSSYRIADAATRAGLEKTRVFCKKPNPPGFFGKTHGFFKKARV